MCVSVCASRKCIFLIAHNHEHWTAIYIKYIIKINKPNRINVGNEAEMTKKQKKKLKKKKNMSEQTK